MKKIITTALLAVGLTAAVSFADSPPSVPAPNEVDYVSQLPNPNDLANKGVPGGARVAMIAQTSADITVTYAYASGQVRIVSYRLLSATGSSVATGSVPVPTTPAPTPVYDNNNASPAYTVVYQQPAPIYYYPAYGYYPWFWPVSVGFGFGFHGDRDFRGGFRGGDFRGGFRGGFHH
ncbi:MAG TPA: hypothetical protein VNW23_05720 [Opitutaceae bacterium]|nr:hypothetical protein [Opitutaceae bacterium]